MFLVRDTSNLELLKSKEMTVWELDCYFENLIGSKQETLSQKNLSNQVVIISCAHYGEISPL